MYFYFYTFFVYFCPSLAVASILSSEATLVSTLIFNLTVSTLDTTKQTFQIHLSFVRSSTSSWRSSAIQQAVSLLSGVSRVEISISSSSKSDSGSNGSMPALAISGINTHDMLYRRAWIWCARSECFPQRVKMRMENLKLHFKTCNSVFI